ncbi:MAG: hypothetical protein ACT4OW_04180 [Nitrososphaerota archaeon]
MVSPSSINRDMLTAVIEKVLLGVSNEVYSFVEKKLSDDYHCKFSDCYENPEFLYRALKELYGNNYTEITKKIADELENVALDQKLRKFIDVITCKQT